MISKRFLKVKLWTKKSNGIPVPSIINIITSIIFATILHLLAITLLFKFEHYQNIKKIEPVMIYATADTNPYIPISNLSTTHKHYRTYTNLCSTIKSTLETCCNLSTATDLQHIKKSTGSATPVGRLM